MSQPLIDIDCAVLDHLTEEARKSPRLRMNRDMRNSEADGSQRMLNALEPGTELPIHRHRSTSETVIVVRGAIEQRFYDDEGRLTGTARVAPDSETVGINVPAGQWHSTVALLPGTVIFEAKDGAYTPLSPDDILR